MSSRLSPFLLSIVVAHFSKGNVVNVRTSSNLLIKSLEQQDKLSSIQQPSQFQFTQHTLKLKIQNIVSMGLVQEINCIVQPS